MKGRIHRRIVVAKEIKAKKKRGEKVYKYSYYTLFLNIYVPKHIIEKYGKEFVVVIDKDLGIVNVYPKKLEDMIKL